MGLPVLLVELGKHLLLCAQTSPDTSPAFFSIPIMSSFPGLRACKASSFTKALCCIWDWKGCHRLRFLSSIYSAVIPELCASLRREDASPRCGSWERAPCPAFPVWTSRVILTRGNILLFFKPSGDCFEMYPLVQKCLKRCVRWGMSGLSFLSTLLLNYWILCVEKYWSQNRLTYIYLLCLQKSFLYHCYTDAWFVFKKPLK